MKKGIIQVFAANMIYLLMGILTNFLLPKYLSVEAYAACKTYTLYMGYTGFLACGYYHGTFLRYGGKTIEESQNMGFQNNLLTYFIMQGVMAAVIFAGGIVLENIMVVLISFGAFFSNIRLYFRNYCSAVGQYGLFSADTVFEKIAVLVLDAALLFLLRTDDYRFYIAVTILITAVECGYYIKMLQLQVPSLFSGHYDWHEIKISTKEGIALLLANTVANIFTGIDQWFIKILMTVSDFAVYSFAVSMERLISLFISPISIIMYNYFCKEQEIKKLKLLQEEVVLWAFALLMGTYPVKHIVLTYMFQYAEAVELVFVLFAGQAVQCIIQCIYINLYNAQKRQKQYLYRIIIMCILAVTLNTVFYWKFGSMIVIAVATLFTKIVWLYVCEKDNEKYCLSWKTNFIILFLTATFLLTGAFQNVLVGMLFYGACYFAAALLFARAALFNLASELISIIKGRIVKEKS